MAKRWTLTRSWHQYQISMTLQAPLGRLESHWWKQTQWMIRVAVGMWWASDELKPLVYPKQRTSNCLFRRMLGWIRRKSVFSFKENYRVERRRRTERRGQRGIEREGDRGEGLREERARWWVKKSIFEIWRHRVSCLAQAGFAGSCGKVLQQLISGSLYAESVHFPSVDD